MEDPFYSVDRGNLVTPRQTHRGDGNWVVNFYRNGSICPAFKHMIGSKMFHFNTSMYEYF